MLGLCAAVVALVPPPQLQRRQVIAGAAATLGAEAGWLQAVAAAAAVTPEDVLLPPGAVEQIEQGFIVAVKNWLPAAEVAALRADAEASFANGHFKTDGLANYGKAQGGAQGSSKGFDPGASRMVMPSFYPSKGTDGPWVDPSIGNAAARGAFKQRMAAVKAALSEKMFDRPTLLANAPQTHEMSYTRYGPGAYLARHTDEHHGKLKLSAKPRPTRRSISWLVYLNDDWNAATDGGCLRVHERRAPSVAPVGARGAELQIGWLRATAREGEQPVFLDLRRQGGRNADATCMLYACAADGSRRDLSAKPFAASPALYLAGGDVFARQLLVDSNADRERFHLVDAPKSAASAYLPAYGEAGEDGGERVRDIPPEGGTLVLFDSVSLPHQVLPTVGRERFACSGWFHEDVIAFT